jgi:hypothetical protein
MCLIRNRLAVDGRRHAHDLLIVPTVQIEHRRIGLSIDCILLFLGTPAHKLFLGHCDVFEPLLERIGELTERWRCSLYSSWNDRLAGSRSSLQCIWNAISIPIYSRNNRVRLAISSRINSDQ